MSKIRVKFFAKSKDDALANSKRKLRKASKIHLVFGNEVIECDVISINIKSESCELDTIEVTVDIKINRNLERCNISKVKFNSVDIDSIALDNHTIVELVA